MLREQLFANMHATDNMQKLRSSELVLLSYISSVQTQDCTLGDQGTKQESLLSGCSSFGFLSCGYAQRASEKD